MELKLSSTFYVAVGAVWADVTTETTVLTVAVVAEVVADASVVVATTPDADMWAVLQSKTVFYF
jgi:ketol-acid reductoisomerase